MSKSLKTWVAVAVVTAGVAVALVGMQFNAGAQSGKAATVPAAVLSRTVSTENLAREGFFHIGGRYVGEPGHEVMAEGMYVEVKVPKNIRHPYPIVFVPGGSHQVLDYIQTPDGRPGWAYNFVDQGYVVYMLDPLVQGRSTYAPEADGPNNSSGYSALRTSQSQSASAELGDFPQAKKYTQWPSDHPNKGKMGDPAFDAYYATHLHGPATPPGQDRNKANVDVRVKLLERIGPSIIVGNSTGGTLNWALADARPHLVKGIIAVEPTGPPIHSVDYAKLAYDPEPGQLWGLGSLPLRYDPPVTDPAQLQSVLQAQAPGPDQVPCYLQKEPARKLVNLQNIPVLFVSAEASYHRISDHCIAKWLNQAGGKAEFIHLEDVGIRGNMHLMMLDRNSQDIAKFIADWIPKNVR